MSKRLSHEDVPELGDWMTLPDAAKVLKLSRQYVHRMAVAGGFFSLHRIGSTFIVSKAEVDQLDKQGEEAL